MIESQTSARESTGISPDFTERADRLASSFSSSPSAQNGECEMDIPDSSKSKNTNILDKNRYSHGVPDLKWTSREPARPKRSSINTFGPPPALRSSHGGLRSCVQAPKAAARSTASPSKNEPRPKLERLKMMGLNHGFGQKPVVPAVMDNTKEGRKRRRVKRSRDWIDRSGTRAAREVVELTTILEEVEL